MLPIHCNSHAINNPFTAGLEAGTDLLLRQPYFIAIKKEKKMTDKGLPVCFEWLIWGNVRGRTLNQGM